VVTPGIIAPPCPTTAAAAHVAAANEKRRQEGRNEQPYNWESVYLYRELKSEAIRLLLPNADDEDIDTLTASIHLGLRLRFEGNPAHLNVSPHIMPDPGTGMTRYYITLLDAVPGGTGYLKTLYQQKDEQSRDGEGIMQVLRLARNGRWNMCLPPDEAGPHKAAIRN
jgi:DEAD/DEAH box helicase domain-containing protein